MSIGQPERPWETQGGGDPGGAADAKKPRSGCLALGLVAIAVVVGGSLLSLGDDDDSIGGPGGARLACENLVKAQLKAPSTADFADVNARESSDGEWVVVGNVDAQNSFGGVVRNRFSCTVTTSDGERYAGTADLS